MPPGLFRLCLATIVVVHHSFLLRMGPWAVGMFFALSGFWISRMWREKYASQPSPYRTFLISRWWRLAPVFFFVHLFAAALVFLGMPVGHPTALSNWLWWATQPMIAGSAQFDLLIPPAWSLDVEMQFYLAAPLIIACLARVRGWQSIGIVTAFAGWGFLRLSLGTRLDTPHLDIYAWLFLSGIACERFQWEPSRRTLTISILLFLAVVGLAFLNSETRNLVWRRGAESSQQPPGTELFFFATTLTALPLALSTAFRRSSNWDRWLGDLSYPLYLFHWIPHDWYYAYADWSLPAWRNAILLACNFAAAGLASIVLLHAVDRPAQRLRSSWLSRRGAK